MCYNDSMKIGRRTEKDCLPPTFAAGIGDTGGRLGGNSFDGKGWRECPNYGEKKNGFAGSM